MKIDEFMETVDKLQKFYDKEMNEEEKKIWFDNFKTMDIKRFKYLVAETYKKSKFMPKLADMIELNKAIGHDSRFAENVATRLKDCDKCGNTGYVVYKKKIENSMHDYVAICSCGRQKPYKNDKYFIPLATELGL